LRSLSSYKTQTHADNRVPEVRKIFGKSWSPFSELQEILKIVTACKSCVGEYPGPTHAHTDLHFNEFWQIILAKHSPGQKKKKNPEMRQIYLLLINSGSREIMAFGRLAFIVQEKKVWACPGIFFDF
jgi:hypothetical protein